MAFDGVTTYHLKKELNQLLVNGRIRKIYQPEKDEIRLLVNQGKFKYHLLLSVNPSNPRAYLTENLKENPSAPPNFCMSLRKYLLNGTITEIMQYKTDRILKFSILKNNEFNDPVVRTLLLELMGRNSNLILLDENDRILDSLKKVGTSSSRYRQILPGRDYIYPPENNRLSFLEFSPAHFKEMLSMLSDQSIESFLIKAFLGISPALAKEVSYRAGLDSQKEITSLSKKQEQFLIEAFDEVIALITEKSWPRIYFKRRRPLDFSTIPLHHLQQDYPFELYQSLSSMLEIYYFKKDKILRFKNKSASLSQQLESLYKKHQKKLKNLQGDLSKAQKGEKFRIWGDLVTANIYQIEKGMDKIDVVNYHDPEGKSIEIPLKSNRSPSENAQAYYKRYNKSKSAIRYLKPYIQETKEKEYYLGSLLNSLDQSTELAELDEIQDEFNRSEFNKKPKPKKKAKKNVISSPYHYLSSEGFHIVVGKNNYQNDLISTKLGENEDCWLHVKDLPGSHVLVIANGQFISEQTLLEAGNLAAWYSKARGSSKIPVDYVEYKYIKKPPKAKPGMIIFTNQRTMVVSPDLNLIESIERLEKPFMR